MKVHVLVPSPGGPHQQHPALEAITRPPLDPHFFEALCLLDLGFLDPELAGRRVLCLSMSVGAVDEELVIQEQDDGRWTVALVDGSPPKDPTRGSAWAEPFESGPQSFARLPTFEAATLEAREYGEVDLERHVVLRIGEPAWLQDDFSPSGEGWRFVARLDCWFQFGSMYVFYHPERRQAYHVIQFT
ncbi:MAG: hypothetical protein H6739_04515 [Alphaproteobacteria bacterium]|nr:hypothetical protein [Alphaproteobacteria bacterium]